MFAIVTATVGACADHARLELVANAFSDAAEKCLLDVRDRKIKYDKSPSCTSLEALSKQYIDAGGMWNDTPAKSALVAEQARTMAWMALAISETGNPALSIW